MKDKPLHFTMPSAKLVDPIEIELQPFYSIHDAWYIMYWMALSNAQYRSYLDARSAAEAQRMKWEELTIDAVAPGERQPEVDHAMQSEGSRKSINQDEQFPEASNGGFFSYLMNTNEETALRLRVRYWGAEWNTHKFDIYIDDQKLVSEDNTNPWNQSRFIEVEYPIPTEMLKGKKQFV